MSVPSPFLAKVYGASSGRVTWLCALAAAVLLRAVFAALPEAWDEDALQLRDSAGL